MHYFKKTIKKEIPLPFSYFAVLLLQYQTKKACKCDVNLVTIWLVDFPYETYYYLFLQKIK